MFRMRRIENSGTDELYLLCYYIESKTGRISMAIGKIKHIHSIVLQHRFYLLPR
jgi:hypothetical protein